MSSFLSSSLTSPKRVKIKVIIISLLKYHNILSQIQVEETNENTVLERELQKLRLFAEMP